jgi:hypothetical protein
MRRSCGWHAPSTDQKSNFISVAAILAVNTRILFKNVVASSTGIPLAPIFSLQGKIEQWRRRQVGQEKARLFRFKSPPLRSPVALLFPIMVAPHAVAMPGDARQPYLYFDRRPSCP